MTGSHIVLMVECMVRRIIYQTSSSLMHFHFRLTVYRRLLLLPLSTECNATYEILQSS